jgi:hypothetical protein
MSTIIVLNALAELEKQANPDRELHVRQVAFSRRDFWRQG